MGVIRPLHQFLGTVPKLRTVLKSLWETGSSVGKLALIPLQRTQLKISA